MNAILIIPDVGPRNEKRVSPQLEQPVLATATRFTPPKDHLRDPERFISLYTRRVSHTFTPTRKVVMKKKIRYHKGKINGKPNIN